MVHMFLKSSSRSADALLPGRVGGFNEGDVIYRRWMLR